MVLELYPRVHRRYTSLAILGPVLDGYGTWLLEQGYSTERVRQHFCAARRLVDRLTATRRGAPDGPDADTVAGLCSRGFAGGPQSRGPGAAGWSGIASPSWRCILRPRWPASSSESLPTGRISKQVRGFAPSTLVHHGRTAGEFWPTSATRPTRRGSTRSNAGISTPSCVPSAPVSRVHPSSMWWATSEPFSASWRLPERSRPGSTRRGCIAASSRGHCGRCDPIRH